MLKKKKIARDLGDLFSIFLCAMLSSIFKDIRKKNTIVFRLGGLFKESSYIKIIIYPHTDMPPHSSLRA